MRYGDIEATHTRICGHEKRKREKLFRQTRKTCELGAFWKINEYVGGLFWQRCRPIFCGSNSVRRNLIEISVFVLLAVDGSRFKDTYVYT